MSEESEIQDDMNAKLFHQRLIDSKSDCKSAEQKELKCGCGGEIIITTSQPRTLCCDTYRFECQKCKGLWSISVLDESDAIAAFRLATNQDLIASQAAEITAKNKRNENLI